MNAKHEALEKVVLKIQWTPGTDATMDRLDQIAEKKGLQRATAARMLLKAGLDAEKVQNGRAKD